MTDVYFTWFGPPQQATKTVSGIDGLQRPDLFGIINTAAATFDQDEPPNFKFCCLKKYVTAFRNDLPNYIDIVCIEDSFPTSDMHSILMSKPSLDNLGSTVDYIMRETLKVRGTTYDDKLLPYSKLAFLKDLWSLYCIWHFGGYHIDCGCYPNPDEDSVSLPDPTTFGAVAITPEGTSNIYHGTVDFPFADDPVCCALVGGNMILRNMVFAGKTTAVGDGRSYLTRNLDVWFLRSPRHHKGAQKALELYVQGWFTIRDKEELNDVLRAEALRELAVSSVLTGATHSGHGIGCSGQTLWKTHMIESEGSGNILTDIKLRKVGFQSHRN